MLNKQHKVYKGQIRSVDNEEFIVEAVVSDESIDRYDEVILASAWEKHLENYKNHPVLLSSHNYGELTRQIGVAKSIGVENGKLVASFKYFVGEGNPEADWGFRLASKGLAAFSVGFIPVKFDNEGILKGTYGENKPSKIYTEVELVEVSQVLVPANADALQRGMAEEDPIISMIAKEIYERGIRDKKYPNIIETSEEIIYNLKDAELFNSESIRSINLMKDYAMVCLKVGELKDNGLTIISGISFPKAYGWDIEGAGDWLDRHPVTSQYLESYLIDRIDELQMNASIKNDDMVNEIIEDVASKAGSELINKVSLLIDKASDIFSRIQMINFQTYSVDKHEKSVKHSDHASYIDAIFNEIRSANNMLASS
jgi:hypothetical protein